MLRRRMAAVGALLALAGCVVTTTGAEVPIAKMVYEAEYAGASDEFHDLLPADDPHPDAVLLKYRMDYSEGGCPAGLMQVQEAGGTGFSSAVYLGREGALLVRKGSRYFRVGTYTLAEGPGPVLPRSPLTVKWDAASFRGMRSPERYDCRFTLALPARPEVVSSPAVVVPDCALPEDRREPAAIYHVETTASPLPANTPFNLTAYVDGRARTYALTRIPVAESFTAVVDPAARTITVIGAASYPDASPEKGCPVPGGVGNYYTPVTVPVSVTAPAGTYTVRIPDTHFRPGLVPSQQNYVTRMSRQEMTVTVE